MLEGKIAIEEHFVPPSMKSLITDPGWPPAAFKATLKALADTERRLVRMDECGISMAVLSLGSNGIQDVLDRDEAVSMSKEANDTLAAIVRRHPDRFAGFAALPLQDPEAAAEELKRSIDELGFKGALINGYSSVGDFNSGAYYDGEAYLPFWEQAEKLGAPIYLHPRNPLPDQRRIYDGREELLGPTWAFAVETGTHALRLIMSGLFDRFPGLRIILGHMGEFLPFAIRRLEYRLSRRAGITLERRSSEYFHENFFITTSGNCHTPSLMAAILEMGADRIIFAADYPFEDMEDAAQWLDTVPISEVDRRRIGSENARGLLGLGADIGAEPAGLAMDSIT